MPRPDVALRAFVGARVRLLNSVEYDNTVAALLGDTTAPGRLFPAGATQAGYSNNGDQAVGALLASALDVSAQSLAATAARSLSTLLPCNPAVAGEAACASSFIASFGPRAFRRPLTAEDRDGLMGIYSASRAAGADFAGAVQTVLYAILSSGSFLYLTELGSGAGTTTLTQYELASALSYLVLASPPDAPLLQAAAAGRLATPDQLEQQARRLLGDVRARAQAKRFFTEWFQIRAATKDATTYPNYNGLVPSFLAETAAFIDDAVFNAGGSLQALLTADYTWVDAPLAGFYGLASASSQLARVPLAGANRVGIMGHASFLSSHGDAATSSPIKRGVFVRRRLLCQTLPPPPPGLDITPPSPLANTTTRALFDAHVSRPTCSGCHRLIDPIGNGFESFDGIGRFRTTENGNTVDSSGAVTDTTDANGPFVGVGSLARQLSQSQQAQDCYTTQLFRFGSAQSDPSTEHALRYEVTVPKGAGFQELLIAYVRSPVFSQRVAP